MATLADVSAKLDASNDQAEAQTKSIDQLNTNFSLFLRELGEDDSAEREEKREASVRGGAAPASAPALPAAVTTTRSSPVASLQPSLGSTGSHWSTTRQESSALIGSRTSPIGSSLSKKPTWSSHHLG